MEKTVFLLYLETFTLRISLNLVVKLSSCRYQPFILVQGLSLLIVTLGKNLLFRVGRVLFFIFKTSCLTYKYFFSFTFTTTFTLHLQGVSVICIFGNQPVFHSEFSFYTLNWIPVLQLSSATVCLIVFLKFIEVKLWQSCIIV